MTTITAQSDEFLPEIIRTFPLEAEGFNLTMFNGPYFGNIISDREKKRQHIGESIKVGVIPFSMVTFEYFIHKDEFFVTRHGISFLGGADSSEEDRARNLSVINGGKPYRVVFRSWLHGGIDTTSPEEMNAAFRRFREGYLDGLLEQGYRIREGEIGLEWDRTIFPRCERFLRFGRDEEEHVLEIYGEYGELSDWFSKLKERYEVGKRLRELSDKVLPDEYLEPRGGN